LYPDERAVPRRLTQLIALWFVVQIVVPFTAPLQTFDVHDALGGTTPRSAQSTPESSTTPTIREGSAVSGLAALMALTTPIVSPITRVDAIERSHQTSIRRPPLPIRVQRSILRL
jgi:hypothetical protein